MEALGGAWPRLVVTAVILEIVIEDGTCLSCWHYKTENSRDYQCKHASETTNITQVIKDGVHLSLVIYVLI